MLQFLKNNQKSNGYERKCFKNKKCFFKNYTHAKVESVCNRLLESVVIH